MKNIFKSFGIIFTIFIFSSCKEKPGPPVLSTTPVTAITTISAVSGGSVTDDGSASIVSRGVCWNTSDNPVITNNKTSNSQGSGSYTSNLTQLTQIPNILSEHMQPIVKERVMALRYLLQHSGRFPLLLNLMKHPSA